jgi:chitodextrinase
MAHCRSSQVSCNGITGQLTGNSREWTSKRRRDDAGAGIQRQTIQHTEEAAVTKAAEQLAEQGSLQLLLKSLLTEPEGTTFTLAFPVLDNDAPRAKG